MTLSHRQPEIQDRQGALSIQHLTPDAQLAPLTSQRETARGGFTLIETALALLAIGMGLLAIFGLGRIGLQSTKESDNDTRCVQLADAIFETLREYNTQLVEEARTNLMSHAWHFLWVNTLAASDRIPFPAVANMASVRDPAQYLQLLTPQPVPAYREDSIDLSEWNPKYQLICGLGKYLNSPVASDGQNIFSVVLIIYPDGDTESSERRIFHTTLTNPGGLP